MSTRIWTALGLAALCACSGGQAEPGETASPEESITMIVRNELREGITVYAEWQGGRRVRLGEIRAGRDRTFATPYRGDAVWLGIEPLGGTPGATGGGPTSFQQTQFDRIRIARGQQAGVPIRAGETIEWTLQSSGELVWLRLDN